ncbi:AAA family ATPase [Chloroflexota bacterium]
MDTTTIENNFQKKDSIYSDGPPEPEYPPDDLWEYSFSENSIVASRHIDSALESKKIPPRYILRDAGYIMEKRLPLPYIVQGLINEGTVSVFYGKSGCGKTYSILHLAVCVALGIPWLGHKTNKVPVLIIDEDNGERRVADRLKEIFLGLGVTDAPIQFVSTAGFKLDKKKDVVEIEKLIEATGAKLIIFDVMAQFMNGDENSKQDVQPILTVLRRMAGTKGISTMMIHHTGKNENAGPRGSSAIGGGVDLTVEIKSNSDETVTFRTDKTRDINHDSFSGKPEWSFDSTDIELTIYTLVPAETKIILKVSAGEEYAERFLREHPNSTYEDIENNADTCAPITARHGVQALVKKGKAFRTNFGEKIARFTLKEDSSTNEPLLA